MDGPIGEDAALLSRVVHGDLLAADPSWFRSMAAQRSMRLQTGAHYELSEHASIAGRVFREDTTDQLIREFASGPIGGGHFDVANAGAWRAYGVGVQLARDMAPITRRLDLALRAAWSAAFVEGRIAEQPDAVATQADASLRAAVPGVAVTALVPGVPVLVQDLSVEGVARIRPSGTRIQGAVRWIFHPDLAPGLASAAVAAAPHTTRFDVEFIQRMPFSTRGAEWEFSVAIRDLFFRDMAERAFLDELAVARAPKRIIGGLAVRF